jgi:hypothetical protein
MHDQLAARAICVPILGVLFGGDVLANRCSRPVLAVPPEVSVEVAGESGGHLRDRDGRLGQAEVLRRRERACRSTPSSRRYRLTDAASGGVVAGKWYVAEVEREVTPLGELGRARRSASCVVREQRPDLVFGLEPGLIGRAICRRVGVREAERRSAIVFSTSCTGASSATR